MPPPLMMRRTGTPISSIRSRITRVWKAGPSIAANSSSCAVWGRRQPSVTPLNSGFTSTGRAPLSRSEERRVGKEGRFWGGPDHLKKRRKDKDAYNFDLAEKAEENSDLVAKQHG